MNPIKIVTISLLAFAMAACGGGGSPDSNSDTSGSGTDGGGTTPVVTVPDGDGSTSVPVENLRFGSGEGENFVPGKITLDKNYSLLAGTLQVSVNVVDNGSANTLVPQPYLYTFNSTCSSESTPRASFNVTSLGSSTGTAATTYKNINCSGNDTLAIKLFSADGKIELAEATATVTGYAPQLGSGSGSGYFDGKISGDNTLATESSSYLSASVVDIADSNALITDSDKEKYTVVWRSSCSDSAFSITTEKLETGNLDTRYDANSCVGVDVVTLSIYATSDLAAPLDTISMNMQIGAVVDNTAVPALSALTIANDHVLAGSNLSITVQGIDANDNSALTGDYKYQFVTDCAAGTGAFPAEVVETSTGSVNTTFSNKNCVTNGDTTLTVNLFEANANVVTDAPLSTLTTKFKTAYPKLGFGSGADFVSGKIDGVTKLVEDASTKLTVNAVDPLDLNSLIDSDDFVAQWSADCAAATFSIESQPLSTPAAVTRYDANTCTGTDTVRVKLFAKDDLATELNSTSISLTISSGAGVTVDAKLSDIDLSNDHALAGETLTLNINGIDVLNVNESLKGNYVYTFESACAGTSFGQASIQSNIGAVSNTYVNTSCGALGSTSTDTLTVKLYEASDLSAVLDTKTLTIDTSYPELGFGSGADFVSSLISGQSVLTNTLSSKLTANAVDNLNLNSKISSNDYVVIWSSSCADSTFSITKQSLASANVETRYDANTCTVSDTVTLSLFAKDDLTTVLDTASLTMNIGQTAGVEVDPKLGFGNGGDFSQGQIELSADYALAGSSVAIIVNGVNTKDNNALLAGNYLYKFESSCPANETSFSSNVIASNNGVVNNTYFNSQCQVTDTITVSLFAEGADTAIDTPLATAVGILETALPKIGSKSGADFIDGVIEGNTNLVDSASTFLTVTVVDPLNVNVSLNSSDYYVEWQSNCATAKFSIASQNISSAVTTRYDGDADLCPTDIVTLTLFNKLDDSLGSITANITINESLIPAVPALGRETGVAFVSEELDFSEANIAARQTIEVAVNIVDTTAAANTLITDTEYAVKFNSVCVRDERSSFDKDLVRTTSGIAKVYYTASGCTGNDTINAVLYAVDNNAVDESSSLAVASGAITIELPEVNSIEYQGMTSRQIALQGISFTELPEVTEVSFIVKDIYNKPVSGKDVAFSLSNTSVDATLSGDLDSDGEVVATTNAEGVVTAYVNSGQTHGLVSVLAVTDKNAGGVLRTQSFGISITTGIPVQPSFSLALDNYNPRGWNANGEIVKATVQLADRFHNPVPNGTIVNFITDGGYIVPTCTTSGGACTVNWTSGNPRPGFNKDNSQGVLQQSKTQEEHPTNDPSSQFYFNKNAVCGADDTAAACDPYRLVEVDPNWNGGRSGVATILAYVEGEVDFADTNGNGRFDDGEAFSAMPETYLDANEDGQYTAPDENNPFEQLIEYVEDGVMTAAPATYQGGSCTEAARLMGHCASLVHLRQEAKLIMSSDEVAFKVKSITGGSSGDLTSATCINVFNEKYVNFEFLLNDYNGNTPLNGTGIRFVAAGFDVDQAPDAILNNNQTEAILIPLTIRAGDEYTDDVGFVRLSATHPNGGEAGFITIENITDSPTLKISTTDYIMDVVNADNAQIVEFKFTDACGNPPAANDIIVFKVTELDIASYDMSDAIATDPITNVKTTAAMPTPRSKTFQINADQLTADGAYRVRIENPDPASAVTEGSITVQAYNVSAGGILTTSPIYAVKMK
ncbi:MAG: hypothetical protein ACJAW8_001345 [Oleispira sp.]|jgi:hypothetical protein